MADDHPIFLTGLEAVLRKEKGFKVLASCATGGETLLAVRKHGPDVLLLDLHLPGGGGFEMIREIRKEKLPVRVVLLSPLLDDYQLVEAVKLGVRGIVLKGISSQLLIQCVRKVHGGERWFGREAHAKALENLLWQQTATREATGRLSRREFEIATLIGYGMCNKEIAKTKFISEGTVKTHLHNIYEKLNIDSRFALALYVRDKGLLQEKPL